MKFMLLCYDDAEHWERAGEKAHREAMQEAVGLTHELDAKGQYLTASPLRPVETATCVRIREGKRLVTDGPFAETREVVAGFSIWEVKDMDEALAWARKAPNFGMGAVEIRPFFEAADLAGFVSPEELAAPRSGERGRLGVA